VVGVDGSPSAFLAIEWGAREASLEQRPLVGPDLPNVARAAK
jgi:hypothetical protein